MNDSTPSGLIHKQSRQIAVVDVGQQGPIPVPVHQRTINEHQFLTHPNCRDARSSVRNRRQSTNIHCSGRALCRPRTQRTYKYHANVHPLRGVSHCGSPQTVMIHNLLVGCRNLRSSLEEAHSSVTPGKDVQRTQPGDSRKQRNSASKRLTSRMRKIITIYELYKSFS